MRERPSVGPQQCSRAPDQDKTKSPSGEQRRKRAYLESERVLSRDVKIMEKVMLEVVFVYRAPLWLHYCGSWYLFLHTGPASGVTLQRHQRWRWAVSLANANGSLLAQRRKVHRSHATTERGRGTASPPPLLTSDQIISVDRGRHAAEICARRGLVDLYYDTFVRTDDGACEAAWRKMADRVPIQ